MLVPSDKLKLRHSLKSKKPPDHADTNIEGTGHELMIEIVYGMVRLQARRLPKNPIITALILIQAKSAQRAPGCRVRHRSSDTMLATNHRSTVNK